MQSYKPAKKLAKEAPYTFTFDFFGIEYGRIFVSALLWPMDLAEMFYHFDVAQFCIARTDGRKLNKKERIELESTILADVRHDFTDDEIRFYFDLGGKIDKSCLWVIVESSIHDRES